MLASPRQADYLAAIDDRSDRIESAFQSGLSGGFRDLYILFAITCVLTLAALAAIGSGRPPRGRTGYGKLIPAQQ